MNTFRLWARRSFALALLIIFVSAFWYLWHFRFCLDMFTAGMIAFCLTMLVGYVAWRAKNVVAAVGKIIFTPQKTPAGRQE
jgi:hypothetical protein